MSANIKITATPQKILWDSDGNQGVSFKVEKTNKELDISSWGTITVKGYLGVQGDKNHIIPHQTMSMTIGVDKRSVGSKFGTSYWLIDMEDELDVDDANQVRAFLEEFATKSQVEEMYKIFENPILALQHGDIEELMKVKGLGEQKAKKMVSRFHEVSGMSNLISKFGRIITKGRLTKIKAVFAANSEDIIKNNTYKLMRINGFGFKIVDEIYLRLGNDPHGEERCKWCLKSCFEDAIGEGNSWLTKRQLWSAIQEKIPGIDGKIIAKVLENPLFIISQDGGRIGLKEQSEEELAIAKELIRIYNSETNWTVHVENAIKEAEKEQGFEFGNQQLEAIKEIFKHQAYLLQGLAGSGKTSATKAVANAMMKQGLIVKGCALSGQASAVLAESSGVRSSTIHRLLGFNPQNMNDKYNGFAYNQHNQLNTQMIILDEISMVDTKMFLSLLKAIPSGCKLIMLGDQLQLKSLFVPVMYSIIQSKVIPTRILTEVHRQAQSSGILMDSIKMRNQENPMNGDQVQKSGVLEDMTYYNVSDDSQIMEIAVRLFRKYIQHEDALNVRVVTQTKALVEKVNNACQQIANPKDQNKKEIKTELYTLREGDIVICRKNNYQAKEVDDKPSAVFNGSVGRILRITNKDLLIDFIGLGKLIIAKGRADDLHLGYAITVHSSQGSSIKHTVCAIPHHFLLNSMNLVYTAVTRAKESCDLVARKPVVASALKKEESSACNTFLEKYLVGLFHREVDGV